MSRYWLLEILIGSKGGDTWAAAIQELIARILKPSGTVS